MKAYVLKIFFFGAALNYDIFGEKRFFRRKIHLGKSGFIFGRNVVLLKREMALVLLLSSFFLRPKIL